MQVQTLQEHLNDATLDKVQNELTDFAIMQAKQHAQQDTVVTEEQYRLGFIEVVRKKVQQVIFEKLSGTLSVSAMVFVNQLKKGSAEKIKKLTAAKNFSEHLIHNITHSEQYAAPQTLYFKKMPQWIWVILTVLGLAEAYFVGVALLESGLGAITSILSVICIATGMVLGSHLLAQKIKQITSAIIRAILSVAVAAFIFYIFYQLGTMRVEAMKTMIQRSLSANSYAIAPPQSLPLTLAVISTFIFLLGFFISLYYAKTQKEKEAINLASKEVEEKQKMANAEAEINLINQSLETKTEAALTKYETSILYLKKLKNIAAIANAKYVATYINYKSGEAIPIFLKQEPDFQFEDFIPKA